MSTTSPITRTPPITISRIPSDSGAGIEYLPMSSVPAWSSAEKCWKASGPGTIPARACSRAKTSVSSISVASACAATVSGRASGTRRVSAPTPVCKASRNAAWKIHVSGLTSGSSALDVITVAAHAHSANRARPLIRHHPPR